MSYGVFHDFPPIFDQNNLVNSTSWFFSILEHCVELQKNEKMTVPKTVKPSVHIAPYEVKLGRLLLKFKKPFWSLK